VAGNAVAQAAALVREQAAALAGEGELDLAAAAAAAEERGTPLDATSYFEPPTVTWAVGAHAAVVAVDPETGEVEIVRYAVVHDCGRELNPLIVAGQMRGGVAQGIGAALYEEVAYDEEGQLLSGTLADYLVPTSEEVPPIELDHLETPSPLNPLGLRGIGEAGAIGPPAAIANAVEDALAHVGAVVRRTPLTPERVLEHLRAPVEAGIVRR